MAVQLSLDRCGVVLVSRSQGRTAPGLQPQGGPTSATDCGSDPLPLTGGGQNRATGQQLRIMHWNAEGVRQKKLELQQFLKSQQIDICCIQETHLNSSHRFSVRGYETHRFDRENRPKGGVLTLVKTNLSSIEVQRSEDADMEFITVKLILPERNLTICNLYSPPNKMMQLHCLRPGTEDWIVVGDFNSHSPSWGYPSLDAKGEEVEDWLIENQLVLVNKPDDPPTFYSRVWKKTSTPDLAIATDNVHKITKREVSEQLGGSDHRPTILTIAKQVIPSTGKLPPSWNYKKANWMLFSQLTDLYTKSITFDRHSVDRNASMFNSAILQAAKKSIPRGRRRDYKPYWNNALEELHKKLSEARENMEKDPTPKNVARHSQIRTDFDKEKQRQTQNSWREKTASLNMEKDTQKLWQLTKTLNEDNSGRRKVTLHTNTGDVTGKTAANVFAKAFEADSTVTVPADRLKDVRSQTRAALHNTASTDLDPCMTERLILRELEEALRKLKQKKAPGPDGISNDMLKHLGPGAKRFLLSIYNQSWSTGTVPTSWKVALIRPIPKKGKDKRDPSSYRPISLLSCVGKLLERIVNKRLLSLLESRSFLAPTQTGYRQHRSTEDQLALLTQEIEDAFQEKKKVLAVFFDLSRAFDTVWKEGLLLKLLHAGVHGKMFKWLSDFLFNRTARVMVDGTTSNLVKLREGVPQGGVISPTLFLVYINDITTTVPKHVSNTLHADDFAVWCAEEHTSTATHRIQNTINSVSSWSEHWALQLNTTKTVSTLFSLSTYKEKVLLKLKDQAVPQVDTPTFLGVTLDTRLTWKPQIEATEGRAMKKLSLMKKLAGTQWGANSGILKQVYTGAVRPVMEYASSTWTTASKTNKGKLDKVQNMGLRIILGAMKSTPIQEMEKTADLEPLEDRREYKAVLQGEKMKRLTTHPLHQNLNKGTKNRLKRKSLKHQVKDLQTEYAEALEADPNCCETLVSDVWAPRKSFHEVRTDVPGLTAKGEQSPHVQKALAMEMIQDRYPHCTWTHVYTDGSSENAVRNGGSGVYIRRPNGTTTSLSVPAGDLSSNYRAELHALITAAEHAAGEDRSRQNIVLLTDSLSALQSLLSGPTDLPTRQLDNCLSTLSQHNKVVLHWIPAHVGIADNEEADRLAKGGARLPQPHNSTSYKEAKTLLQRKKKENWKKRNGDYNPQEDPINKLDRRSQTTIFRLRTGHCGLKKHLKRLGLADDAHCECGSEEQTPEHILQNCPHLETIRQKFWQEETSVGAKLWGPADELRKTADFLAATGLRI
ncbi:hypothetical protein V1264_019826 [Littorina saxatilis]|uniref:Uncharacterized protein n=1 Tax=Littorina saxatilis TaxID=31220 RepID=A0AAN9BA62_9CAEN